MRRTARTLTEPHANGMTEGSLEAGDTQHGVPHDYVSQRIGATYSTWGLSRLELRVLAGCAAVVAWFLAFVSRHFAFSFAVMLSFGLVFQNVAQVFNPFIRYPLMMALCLGYLRVDVSALVGELRRPLQVLGFALYALLVVPVIVYGLVHMISATLSLDPIWRTASLLLFAAPTGAVAPAASLLLGARLERAVTNMVVTAFLAPFSIPFLLWLLAGTEVQVGFTQLSLELGSILVLPAFVALIARNVLPSSAAAVAVRAGPLSVFFLWFVIIGAVSGLTSQLLAHPEQLVITLGILAVLFGLAFVGPMFFLKSKPLPDRLTVAIATTWMNNGIIIVIASQMLRDPTMTLVATLSEIPWGLAFMPAQWWVLRQRKRGANS